MRPQAEMSMDEVYYGPAAGTGKYGRIRDT